MGAMRFKSWAGQSNTELSIACHHCNISSKGVVLLGCNDVEMGPANSLHASMYYSEYNERFDLISFMISVTDLELQYLEFFVNVLELNKFDVTVMHCAL